MTNFEPDWDIHLSSKLTVKCAQCDEPVPANLSVQPLEGTSEHVYVLTVALCEVCSPEFGD